MWRGDSFHNLNQRGKLGDLGTRVENKIHALKDKLTMRRSNLTQVYMFPSIIQYLFENKDGKQRREKVDFIADNLYKKEDFRLFKSHFFEQTRENENSSR